MIIYKQKNKIKPLAILVIIASVILGITDPILAQSDSEKNLTNSEKTPTNSDNPSSPDRGSPSRGFPENSPNPEIIPIPQRNQTQSSDQTSFTLNVIPGTSRRSLGDIVKTLEDDNRFQTLIEILKLAGLDAELERPEFIVLFAPTEEAFNRLPAELYEQLILPENRSKLIELLKNHYVVAEIISRGDDKEILLKGIEQGEIYTIQTLNGQVVRVKVNSNEVQINEVNAKKDEFILTQDERVLIVPIERVLFAPSLEIQNSKTENQWLF